MYLICMFDHMYLGKGKETEFEIDDKNPSYKGTR